MPDGALPGFFGDGLAANADTVELNTPIAVALDSSGNLYIADSANQRIRKVTKSTGKISTIAGNGTAQYSGDGGAATSASLDTPYGVAVDSSGQRLHRRLPQSRSPQGEHQRHYFDHRRHRNLRLLGRWRTGDQRAVKPAVRLGPGFGGQSLHRRQQQLLRAQARYQRKHVHRGGRGDQSRIFGRWRPGYLGEDECALWHRGG